MAYGSWSYSGFAPYVPVAERRRQANREAQRRAKAGQKLQPVNVVGKKITTTFWGDAWCKNLESYSDYSNRLPRGRTYVRNGSVLDLQIEPGLVRSLVYGSHLYEIEIRISQLPKSPWKQLCRRCSSETFSMLDLMRGRLSDSVIQHLTDRQHGMFPKPSEIRLSCTCPDWATMCKHVAATLYGVGQRLDSAPELLFLLRGVDQAELIAQAMSDSSTRGLRPAGKSSLSHDDLESLFGIELAEKSVESGSERTARPRRSRSVTAKPPRSTPRKTPKATAKASPKTKAKSTSAKTSAKAVATAKATAADRSPAKTSTKTVAKKSPKSPPRDQSKRQTAGSVQRSSATGAKRSTKKPVPRAAEPLMSAGRAGRPQSTRGRKATTRPR